MKTFSEFLQEDKYNTKLGTWQKYGIGINYKYHKEKPRALSSLKRKRSFIPTSIKQFIDKNTKRKK